MKVKSTFVEYSDRSISEYLYINGIIHKNVEFYTFVDYFIALLIILIYKEMIDDKGFLIMGITEFLLRYIK